jgi:hypothetical protein
MTRGRGRLTAIDLLPDECSEAIAWASQELAKRERTQIDIYAEFKTKLIALQGEFGLGFDIPSFSSFNRHSLKLAQMTRRLEQTREIAASISERFDAGASDELTLISAEAIKTLIFELLQGAGEGGISPKGAMELANALRAATAAQTVSSARREKLESLHKVKTEAALKKVAKEAGLSKEMIAIWRREFLGVKPKADADSAKAGG